MSLLPRWRSFGLGRNRAEEAALQERVTALQTALARCKATARRWTELRGGLVAAIAALMLALGFVLGLYSGPLKQAAVDLVAALGLAPPVRNADAAIAAYQDSDYATALKLSRPLADQGDARAQSILGLIYYGGRGVPQDDQEAVKWFRRAADQGDASGHFYLGNMFADGRGVPQDYAEATKWYRLAADLGDAQAQYNLGLSYAKGEGVSQDNVSAHMWFNLAAARFPTSDTRNRNAAARNRELVASKMTPDEIAEAQKQAREWKPK